MFDSFYVLIELIAAVVSFTVGVGLWAGGRLSETPGLATWGRRLMVVSLLIVIFSWVWTKRIERDKARDAQQLEQSPTR